MDINSRKSIAAFAFVIAILALLVYLKPWASNTPSAIHEQSKPSGKIINQPVGILPSRTENRPKNGGDIGTERRLPSVSDGLFEPAPVDPKNPRPTFPLFDQDFVLTSRAIEFANLTNEQAEKIQECANELKEELRTATANATEPDNLRTNAESGVYAFRVAPFIEEGRRIREAFMEKVEGFSSPDQTARLGQTFNWHRFFSASGECETLVKFYEVTNGSNVYMKADWELRHPDSGKTVLSTSASYTDFVKSYGDILSVVEE